MQQMRGAMVAHDILAALADHVALHAVSHAQMTFVDLSIMDDLALDGFARILNLEGTQRARQLALVADLAAEMAQMDAEFAALKDQADSVRAGFTAVTSAFNYLEEVGVRLPGYIAAEAEFSERWAAEKAGIAARLGEMETLRDFYEGYSSAYDSLILEVERRRAVEEKIQGIWRKAKEQVFPRCHIVLYTQVRLCRGGVVACL